MRFQFSKYNLLILSISFVMIIAGGLAITDSQKKSLNQLPIAKVISVSGNPQLRNHGSPFWEKVTVQQVLFENDRLRTEKTDSIVIQFTDNNSLLTLHPLSSINLEKPSSGKLFTIEMGQGDHLKTKNEDSKINEQKLIELQNMAQKLILEKEISMQTTQGVLKINPLSKNQNDFELIKPQKNEIQYLTQTNPFKIDFFWSNPSSEEIEITIKSADQKKVLHQKTVKSSYYSYQFNSSKQEDLFFYEIGPKNDPEKTQKGILNWVQVKNPQWLSPEKTSYNLSDLKNNQGIFFNWSSPAGFTQHELKISGLPGQTEPIELLTNQYHLTLDKINRLSQGQHKIIFQVKSNKDSLLQTEWSEPLVIQIDLKTSLDIKLLSAQVDFISSPKGQWQCKTSAQAKIETMPLADDSQFQVHWTFKDFSYLTQPLILENKNEIALCPPFPAQSWQAEIFESSVKLNLQRKSKKPFKMTSSIITPLQLTKAYILGQNEVLLATDGLLQTKFEYQLQYSSQNSSQIAAELEPKIIVSDIPSVIYQLPTQGLVSLKARYLDLNDTPLSSWSNSLRFKTLMSQPKLLAPPAPVIKPPVLWTLFDAGQIYVSEKKQKPWTYLKWSSDQKFDYYQVDLSDTEDFKNVTFSEVTRANQKIITIKGSQTFFWRVRGKDNKNEFSNWSPIRKVNITVLNKMATE